MPTLLAAIASIELFGIGWLPTALIAAAVALVALFILRPALPVRWAIVLFVRIFYRMRVIGQENVPANGPALFVCNHVSYIDWILLLAAQRRVIRFVVFSGWTKKPLIRHLLRWGKVIPIDATSGPRAIVKSLQAASEALSRGDLVCIFAEGRFTRTGFLLPFRRGFEEIAKRGNAPIIPVCLDELWGSIFSFYGDRCLWKWPRQLPYSVTVAFGKSMPAESNAEEVRLAVQQLAADAAMARADELLPVHRQFVRIASRRRFRRILIESKYPRTVVLSNFQVLARCILLTWRLRARLSSESKIGIWLPQGINAAIANIVVLMCGKAAVNLGDDWPSEKIQSVIEKCKVRYVLTSLKDRSSLTTLFPDSIELIDIESLQNRTNLLDAFLAKFYALVLPGFFLDHFVLRLPRHQLNDLATVLFSIGEASTSKGVLLTHRNLAASSVSLVKTYDLSSRDRIFGILPFSHCVGYSLTLWTPLSIGIATVYHGGDESSQISAACNNHRCTVLPADNAKLQQLFAYQTCDFRSLRTLICCGRLLNDGENKYEQQFSCKPLETYYRTELSSITATNVPDKTLENFTQIGNKPGTVGQPLVGMAARIVHPETLESLSAGQEGLLQIRTASLMKGYLADEAATKLAVCDGWFSTGDIARIDEHGFITIIRPI